MNGTGGKRVFFLRRCRRVGEALCLMVAGGLLAGCGLLMDAAQLMHPYLPGLPDEVEAICRHAEVRVGVATEPSPPFVFPVRPTGEGPKLTGLDMELVHHITAALSEQCGHPLTAVPIVLPFRDLFLALTENKLDIFVSAMASNVPHLTATGLGYSSPYYLDTGIVALTGESRVADRLVMPHHGAADGGSRLEAKRKVFSGLRVAVQEERSPHLLAAARLSDIDLMVCDTFAAALAAQPPADVVLGKEAILGQMGQRHLSGWQVVTLKDGQPMLLGREYYAVAMAESEYRLRWLVNDVILDLEQSGRLEEMRRRWFDPKYADSEAALRTGILCSACQETQPADRGSCRPSRSR